MSVFVNFSNHPVESWSAKQLAAAESWGRIEEIPFPNVPASASEADIRELADVFCERILALEPACVMCQGEFTLSYAVVSRLSARGIVCVAACSERISRECRLGDASSVKTSTYTFCRFRRFE